MCFDANLPGLEKCKLNCEFAKGRLCVHRFNHKVQIESFDSKRFPGWSDLDVLTYFLGRIFVDIAKRIIIPNDCIFMMLTKDRNFIDDIKKEWEEKKAWRYLPITFSGNFISCGGLAVFIQQVDCPNYGNNRADDLRCIFRKVNDFLLKTKE